MLKVAFDDLIDACTIDVDGTVKEVAPIDGKKFMLNELYKHTGATSVEIVKAYDGRVIVIDEEGLLKPNSKTNVKASLLYLNGDKHQIVGKVLICKPKMIR